MRTARVAALAKEASHGCSRTELRKQTVMEAHLFCQHVRQSSSSFRTLTCRALRQMSMQMSSASIQNGTLISKVASVALSAAQATTVHMTFTACRGIGRDPVQCLS